MFQTVHFNINPEYKFLKDLLIFNFLEESQRSLSFPFINDTGFSDQAISDSGIPSKKGLIDISFFMGAEFYFIVTMCSYIHNFRLIAEPEPIDDSSEMHFDFIDKNAYSFFQRSIQRILSLSVQV